MSRLFKLLIILIYTRICLCNRKCYSKYQPKIYGGYEAKTQEFPHHVGVGIKFMSNGEIFCGGSLLNNRFALTAAHCQESFTSIFSTYILVGATNIKEGRYWYKIKEYFYHPEWSRELLENDLLLLKTEKVIKMKPGFVEVIKLPGRHTNIPSLNQKVWTCGWGMEKPNTPSMQLKKINLYIVSEEQCTETWGPSPQKRICVVSNHEGWGTCSGDSGAGLVYNKRLVGVLSYGTVECDLNEPEVYTDLHIHLDWIHDIIDQK